MTPSGPWKLIPGETSPAGAAKNSDQLFQLAKDPGESKNLAGEHPDRVKELSDLLRRIRADGRSRP